MGGLWPLTSAAKSRTAVSLFGPVFMWGPDGDNQRRGPTPRTRTAGAVTPGLFKASLLFCLPWVSARTQVTVAEPGYRKLWTSSLFWFLSEWSLLISTELATVKICLLDGGGGGVSFRGENCSRGFLPFLYRPTCAGEADLRFWEKVMALLSAACSYSWPFSTWRTQEAVFCFARCVY